MSSSGRRTRGFGCVNFGKDGVLEAVISRISQEILAERVQTTRSRPNFLMNKFRKFGSIGHNSDLHLRSGHLNVFVHDERHVMASAVA
jgi:CRP/FNR family transcriptional regulator, cyclic AMP receptor protein